jgi:hypothetical protein
MTFEHWIQALGMAIKAMRNGSPYAAYAILLQVPDRPEFNVKPVLDMIEHGSEADMTYRELLDHVEDVIKAIEPIRDEYRQVVARAEKLKEAQERQWEKILGTPTGDKTTFEECKE